MIEKNENEKSNDLKIEINNDVASTLINLCTLYSQMGKHKIALKYSLESNEILQ
jgi:hypothetical protein